MSACKEEMSTRSIAKEMGLSRSMVERIEARALRKVREALAERGFCEDDLKIERGQHPLAGVWRER